MTCVSITGDITFQIKYEKIDGEQVLNEFVWLFVSFVINSYIRYLTMVNAARLLRTIQEF